MCQLDIPPFEIGHSSRNTIAKRTEDNPAPPFPGRLAFNLIDKDEVAVNKVGSSGPVPICMALAGHMRQMRRASSLKRGSMTPFPRPLGSAKRR
jgi:hypothetical protein